MTRKVHQQQPKGALELADEAVHLLRLAPGSILACYYVGSLPFILALLYFWADMSRGAFAEERCAPAAFGMAALFVWMKCWQAIFARQLLAHVTGESLPALTFPRLWRAGIVQTAIQPSGLFLLPLAALIALPFGWVYAFYQNVTTLGGADRSDVKAVFKKSLRQAELWPKQNHLALLLLFNFGLFVFLNIILAAIFIPQLIKMMSGVELMFAKSWYSIFNTTFLTAAAGVTYLCLDPLIKAFFVLRCFYGESLHSGEDLKVELKQHLSAGKAAVAASVVFLCCSMPHRLEAFPQAPTAGTAVESSNRGVTFGLLPLFARHERGEGWGEEKPNKDGPPLPVPSHPSEWKRGRRPLVTGSLMFLNAIAVPDDGGPAALDPPAEARSPATQDNISVPLLDRSISETINQREYSWRLPRQKAVPDFGRPKGIFESFADGIVTTIKGWLKSIGKMIEKSLAWLAKIFRQWFESNNPPSEASGFNWLKVSQYVLFVLLVVIASVLAVLLWRLWKRRQRSPEGVVAQPVAAVPDLMDEAIVADQLPEDDWLKLARELVEKGELRRALRALFLASLAHLAQREMITLAQFKSNREYERELRRRIRALPDLQTAFAQNVLIYDSIWYGMHEVSHEIVNQFKTNLERIKAC
jgi:hypothetical protein